MSKGIKIALIGYGKMGKMIEQVALNQGCNVVAKITSQSKNIKYQVSQADVCIDFSHPNAILQNIEALASGGVNCVVGTTGWYDHLDKIKEIINQANIGFLYSPNFSLGIALFHQLVRQASALIGVHDAYDIGGLEIHHRNKIDKPSGTAMSLANTIIEAHPKKSQVNYNQSKEKLPPHEFNFTSLRVGFEPGSHLITFDSEEDSITLTHTARNRQGFAKGAVSAAEWILGKKGLFTFDDMLLAKKSG